MTATGWRNGLYGLAILVGLAALVVAPALVSATLPRQGPPLSGRVEIGYGASITAPPGSRLDLVESRPGAGEIVLLVDDLRLRLTAQSFRGDPAPFVRHARHRIARDEWLRPDGPPSPLETPTGLRGEWGSLVSVGSHDGPSCYAVLTSGGVGVTALVTPTVGCASLPPPVRAALVSVRVKAP